MTACSRGWHRSPQLSTALHGICDRHAVVPCVPSDKALALLQVAYIPDRHWLTPSWMHDFACTDKYAVLLEQPLYMVRFVEDPWVIDSVWDTPVSLEAVLLKFTSIACPTEPACNTQCQQSIYHSYTHISLCLAV